MIELREAFAADRDAILALRRRAFPDVDREKQEPAFWDWEFQGGRMFVAVEDSRVVGHFGFVPRRFTIGDALLAVDAMVDPAVQRQGVFTRLAQFAIEGVRGSVPFVIAWQIRPAVLEGMLRAGWEGVLSAPVVLRATLGSIPIPLIRPFDKLRATFSPVAGEKGNEERFASSPVWRYTRRENGGAYLVSRDSVLKSINTHCLVEFGGEARALRALVHEAIADARRRGVKLAAALVSGDHPHFATLLRCGFFPGPHRFRLLAQAFDPRIDLHQRWALTWASTDHV